MHFKSTLEQANKHQSSETIINSIKKSRLDINLKSSIVRIIERNQLLIQLKLAQSTLLKTIEISNDVCILNVVDQVKELIISNQADIRDFFIKTLHQKIDKVMKKLDSANLNKSLKQSMMKTSNPNSNSADLTKSNFNSAHLTKPNPNPEVAKLT